MFLWCCYDAVQESFNLNVYVYGQNPFKKEITYDISAKYFLNLYMYFMLMIIQVILIIL